MIRVIVEIPTDALFSDDSDSRRDEITDKLIEAFNTPLTAVLDLVTEEDQSVWYRSEHF